MSNELISQPLTTEPLTTKDINRRDLLRMGELSDDLNKHDLVFISNRGEMDAVMMRPDRLLLLLQDGDFRRLAGVVCERLRRDAQPTLTDRDISILRTVGKLGNARLTDIADAMNQQPSNIHRALQGLVDHEIVDRLSGDDITYSLTGLGRRVIEGV